MAKFLELEQIWSEFQNLLNVNISGIQLFEKISVEEPKLPEDELHFVKLVAWSYIFFVESFPALYKQISSTLRSSDALSHKRVGEVYLNVHALRTVQGHNLKVSSSDDQKKVTLVAIWKATHGGTPFDWATCCEALCTQMTEVINILQGTIQKLLSDPEDFEQFRVDLLFSIERTWEPHSFDRIIEDAAERIGIKGLDVKKYRDGRIKEWRDSVSLFASRADAEHAVSRMIRVELKKKFGAVEGIEE
jgi:hypothetical protein